MNNFNRPQILSRHQFASTMHTHPKRTTLLMGHNQTPAAGGLLPDKHHCLCHLLLSPMKVCVNSAIRYDRKSKKKPMKKYLTILDNQASLYEDSISPQILINEIYN